MASLPYSNTMQAAQDKSFMNIPIQAFQELITMLKGKETEINLYKNQIEHLQRKLSDGENSLQDTSGQKAPLLRAKSDPVSGNLSHTSKQNSNLDIFQFPDSLVARGINIGSQHVLSQPLSNVGKTCEPGSNFQVGIDVTKETPDTSLNLRSNIPTSWLAPSMASQGCTGVSELYFRNVLNELVKTKKYLNNLLTQQKQGPDKTVELNNLRQEIQQLVFTNQNLQRELEEQKQVMGKTRKNNRCLIQTSKRDDSIEIENLKEENKGTQTVNLTDTTLNSVEDLTNQLKTLVSEKQVLQREREKYMFNVENILKEKQGLKRELGELQSSYKSLSTQVVSLSTVLQDERVKNKILEDSLRSKNTEAKKLSEQLCILRQKYEELMTENNALEKTLALVGPRAWQNTQHSSITSSGRYSSSSDKRAVHTSSHGGSPRTSFHSGSSTSCRTSGPGLPFARPATSESPQQQQQVLTPSSNFPLNNLSPKEPEERKPMNLPMLGQPSMSPATEEIVAQEEWECPTCLQNFHIESSYLRHLEKCVE